MSGSYRRACRRRKQLTTVSPEVESLRRLVFDDVMRSLQRQATVLAELRGRANILLAADAVVASLFGPTALKDPHPLSLAIGALIAFAGAVVGCIAVLWAVHDHGEICDPDEWLCKPRWPSRKRPRKWRVTFGPDQVMRFLAAETQPGSILKSPEYTPFRVARRINYRTISLRTRYFQFACVLLAAQIGCWTALVFAQP